MQSYLKIKPTWVQFFIFIGMAFGVFLVFTLIGVIILSKITGIPLLELSDSSKWDMNNPAMLTFLRGMLVIQFLGLFLIPSLLFGYFSDPHPTAYLGFKKPNKAIYLLLGVAALMVSLPFIEWLGVINRNVHFPASTEKWMKGMEEDAARQIQFMLGKHNIQNLLLNLVFISGFAAVGEELFFRGVLQRLFIRWFRSPWAGIIVTGFIFSAIHFQFYGFLPRFILGILLGAAYWYSGSLWVAILAHFVYDAFFIVVAYYNPSMVTDESAGLFDQAKLLIPSFISLFFTIVIVWAMKRNSTVSYAAVYKEDKPSPDNPFSF
jgi:uncharacterized protein